MEDKVKYIQFSRLYNAFHGVVEDANKAVQRSADWYIKTLQGDPTRRPFSYVIKYKEELFISSHYLYNYFYINLILKSYYL